MSLTPEIDSHLFNGDCSFFLVSFKIGCIFKAIKCEFQLNNALLSNILTLVHWSIWNGCIIIGKLPIIKIAIDTIPFVAFVYWILIARNRFWINQLVRWLFAFFVWQHCDWMRFWHLFRAFGERHRNNALQIFTIHIVIIDGCTIFHGVSAICATTTVDSGAIVRMRIDSLVLMMGTFEFITVQIALAK